MKHHLSVVAVLAGVVALPAMARAQHSRPADAPAIATAAPVNSPPPPQPAQSSQPSTSSSQPAIASGSGVSGSTQSNSGGNGTSNDSGRRRGNLPPVATAVPRRTPAPGDGATTVVIESAAVYPPWAYESGAAIFGFGGYYNGYLGPDDQGPYSPLTYSPGVSISDEEGAIRLKVKPADASVYIDGFYVGVVDDFDGTFQRLKLDAGPHRIEMRSPGHQTLSVDVIIQPDLTITYRGELEKR
jgi:hypothetical protein